MSNPLNEQVAELIADILSLEEQHDKEKELLDTLGAFPVMSLKEPAREKLLPRIEQFQRLRSRIDSQRQKLVSLELLVLDNTIKSLQSTTTQVLASSTRLESFTRALIYVTALLGIVSIFNTGVVTLQFSLAVGVTVIVISSAAMAYLGVKSMPKLRRILKQ